MGTRTDGQGNDVVREAIAVECRDRACREPSSACPTSVDLARLSVPSCLHPEGARLLIATLIALHLGSCFQRSTAQCTRHPPISTKPPAGLRVPGHNRWRARGNKKLDTTVRTLDDASTDELSHATAVRTFRAPHACRIGRVKGQAAPNQYTQRTVPGLRGRRSLAWLHRASCLSRPADCRVRPAPAPGSAPACAPSCAQPQARVPRRDRDLSRKSQPRRRAAAAGRRRVPRRGWRPPT